MSVLHACSCFEHTCSSSGGQNFTMQLLVSSYLGIITPIGVIRCDDTRGCIVQFWPPDDEHLCSKHEHGTATYRCDDTRGCIVQFWPPDDEHVCSKHVEA